MRRMFAGGFSSRQLQESCRIRCVIQVRAMTSWSAGAFMCVCVSKSLRFYLYFAITGIRFLLCCIVVVAFPLVPAVFFYSVVLAIGSYARTIGSPQHVSLGGLFRESTAPSKIFSALHGSNARQFRRSQRPWCIQCRLFTP